tara:strand:+ start:4422 stop:7331 length:2910 start_codon:yes stop_codon:yes gene_type:complete
MDIKELESLLQSNRIDLRNLNPQQKVFIDTLQKKGVIDVPPLGVMENKQNEAAKVVAAEKRMMADPISEMTSDQVNRDKVQMYTDIGFLTASLFMDRKRLAGAILNPKKFIADLNKVKSTFKNPLLNKTVTGIKQVGATAMGMGGTVAAQGAMRAALAGALGYSAGGVAYDLADEIARDQLDLKKKVGDVTYKDMMEKNPLLRTLDDFRVGLTFNAGAELLGPLAANSMYGLRKIFGLETPYARAMAEIAKKNNLKLSYIMAADPNTMGGKILKGVNRIFGQLPYIGRPAAEAQLGAIKQFNDISSRIFELQPGMHLAIAAQSSERAANQVLKTYEKFMNINSINFNRFLNQARAFGDPRVIDLNNVNAYFKALQRDTTAPPELVKFIQEQDLQTPFGQFIAAYQKMAAQGRPISISEYSFLRTMLNRSTAQLSKNEPSQMIYTQLQKALEEDFAKMDLSPGRQITLRENVATKDMIETGGNLVQAEVKSTVGETGLTQAKKLELKENIEHAFEYYANNIKTFESLTARKLAAFDQNALSYKQMIDFYKAGNTYKDQMLKTISRNIFQTKSGLSFSAITDLQKLLDSDVHKVTPFVDASGNTAFRTDLVKKGSKEGNESLRRLWGAHVGNAYQMSFRPIEKNAMGDWIESYLLKEQQKAVLGQPYKTVDDLLMPNGLPAKNLGGGNVYFDADVFRRLVLPNEASATQMRIIFGQEKANQLLKNYDDLLSYMDAVKSYVVPEASTFLARRLVLSGPNIAVGAGAYGMGFFPMAVTLFLGNRANRILSNPKAAETINSAFKSFLERPGDFGGLSTFSRFHLAKIANATLNDYVPEDYKFDESDASMQEIFKILDQTKSPVDPLADLNMNKKDEENMYLGLNEEEGIAAVNTLPDIEYLTQQIGGLPANMEEEAMMARAVNTMPANQPITPTTLPRQQGLRIPGPGIKPVDYASLFPFDPLGNTIASRKAQG